MTGQDGPGTRMLITGRDRHGIRVTGQYGSDTIGLTKRSKFGHNGANENGKRYLKKIWRIKINKAEKGRVSEFFALASHAALYDMCDARI